MLKIHQY